MDNLKVGDLRNFDFVTRTMTNIGYKDFASKSKHDFVIVDVFFPKGLKFEYAWASFRCPKCQETFEDKVIHHMIEVELMVLKGKEDKFSIEDILVYAKTLDNKLMVVPAKYRNEVLSQSKKFSNLIKK